MFTTVLVANRGEIACRVIRTLHALGIHSVAVYTEADRYARHVALAERALRVDSYLDAHALVAAALSSRAQAVHPGYGFLSENTDFARACIDAGVVFLGPGAAAIEMMGDKIRAKAHVATFGVPVIPGAGTTGMTDSDLIAAATSVGFPLLVKPSAGGGGKGMSVVTTASALPEALAASRRLALTSFGDDTLLLERLVRRPRHIEVQVLADTHGRVMHLGERECSLQRRHQKIIEEAPSPLLDAATRAAIGAAACDVARSVDYVGAGTVEFLVSDEAPGEFFFMEMNTRLQVEHPVTELVTGVDLVEWQLRIAAGEPLTIDEVTMTGHAIEARLYSEDVAAGFLPATGTVLALSEAGGTSVRVDSALVEGLVISAAYDPMLAKIIAWGETRGEAIARLDHALADTVVLGVRTNTAFLRGLLADDDVRAGRLDTGIIERLPAMENETPDAAAAATAALLQHAEAWRTGSPWRQPSGFRVGAHRPPRYGGVEVSGAPGAAVVDGIPTRFEHDERTATIEHLGIRTTYRWARADGTLWLHGNGQTLEIALPTREQRLEDHRATLTRTAGAIDPEVRSAMPGTVVSVATATGTVVEAGAALLTIEAMKMEHTMLASIAGVVTLTVRSGDQVRTGQVVARIDPHGTHPHEGAPA